MRQLLAKLRRGLRCLWVLMLAASGCLWWAKRRLRASGAVIALMLHRVLDDDAYLKTHSLPGIVVRERTFRELVSYVTRRCEPVDLQQAEPGKPSRRIRIVFTFDDGWSDNHSIAFPIARRNDIPVTVFICPGLMDRESPFWPEEAAAFMTAMRPAIEISEIESEIEKLKAYASEKRTERLGELSEEARRRGVRVAPSTVDRTVSWADVGEMSREGIQFGSHTLTHQILTKVPLDEASKEIRESKLAVESALSKRCEAFSYPNGDWSPDTRRLLAEQGFRLAFTTERGAWTSTCDPLAIPRSNVSEDNLAGLTGRFSTLMFEYTTFWKSWRAMKAKMRLAIPPTRVSTATAV
jgi:peptidoglycan/xylan/chitin deacetylase (PgdA/CDA1 family)